MPDMRIPEIVNGPEKVQLARLSHVYFKHPNLDEFSKFARDFGFVLVFQDKKQLVFPWIRKRSLRLCCISIY
jgi:hypothetical protein